MGYHWQVITFVTCSTNLYYKIVTEVALYEIYNKLCNVHEVPIIAVTVKRTELGY